MLENTSPARSIGGFFHRNSWRKIVLLYGTVRVRACAVNMCGNLNFYARIGERQLGRQFSSTTGWLKKVQLIGTTQLVEVGKISSSQGLPLKQTAIRVSGVSNVL